jgi:hypothetical protein
MLTNKIPFGLLSNEEQKLFSEARKKNLELYDGSYGWSDASIETSSLLLCKSVYRLKINLEDKVVVNDVIYTIIGDNERIKDYHVTISHLLSLGDHNEVRALTKEEINSVKPHFKRGDVVQVSLEEGLCICRIGFSFLSEYGDIIFNSVCGLQFIDGSSRCDISNDTRIKQLVLEEMKHGKKWNGVGYDECLTADGLTWNELVKHDVSDIEFLSNEKWINACIELSDDELVTIKTFRLKPKETFVDVEIDYGNSGEARVEHPDGEFWSLNLISLRIPVNGFFINKYIFSDSSECIYPVKTKDDKFVMKATHARFVKVGE